MTPARLSPTPPPALFSVFTMDPTLAPTLVCGPTLQPAVPRPLPLLSHLTDGLFSENLGDTADGYAAINESVFAYNDTLYLAVTINSEALTPLKRITSQGFAINSSLLDGFDSSSSGGTSSFCASHRKQRQFDYHRRSSRQRRVSRRAVYQSGGSGG